MTPQQLSTWKREFLNGAEEVFEKGSKNKKYPADDEKDQLLKTIGKLKVENYWRRSPLSLVANVTTPTMLLTVEKDFRTPISESEQYYAALKLQGVESAMVRIPNASRGLVNRPSMLMSKSAPILGCFNYYRDNK